MNISPVITLCAAAAVSKDALAISVAAASLATLLSYYRASRAKDRQIERTRRQSSNFRRARI